MSKEFSLVKMPKEHDLVLKTQKYSEEVLNNVLDELNCYAQELDTEIGLPSSNEDLKKMRDIILKNLQ